MNGLTVCDWQLILAAYAYEYSGMVTMTDASYERMSAEAKARDSKIPGFLDYTGSWVGALDLVLINKVLLAALRRNMGKDDLHGPAIQAALDELGIEYTCCLSYNCWESET